MNQPQGNRSRSSNQRRRPQQQHGKKAHAIDVWRTAGELPEVQKIPAPTDVSALLRSLGDPPVGNGSAAGHYFNAVVERAAAVALALAVSADLLAADD